MDYDSFQEKYFSLFRDNFGLTEDDLTVSETDTVIERELKQFIKDNHLNSETEPLSGTSNPSSIDKDISQLKQLLTGLLESGDIDREVVLEALSYGLTEMAGFIHHEPDHHYSFSDQEKDELHNMMKTILQKTETEEHQAICESLFPDMVNHLESVVAKIRTPRF
ncbi:hypothetical protein [Endozoicomonas sp. SCSIO W0465]|uniref:hypothetical protein n=1 Tax=Endozoicomonas sp. SCSIO W0465 TaxID=2918516 RepID=UPI002075B273|nr:hypothetical protein [Endozoicomonas sp. SCSIO W0465]USE37699.1 hypothetical protein MJO57_05725 [Endozoicomonas sp. SCSIO W0465]